MMLVNLRNLAVLKIQNVDYCFILSGTSKSEARNLLQNTDLTEKSELLYKK